MEKFSSNETLDNVVNRDPTVEIIGYVDRISLPKQSVTGNQNMKFFLNNAQGRRVQVTTWNQNIQRVQELINSVNLIVHINGALASIPKETYYNQGDVPYELIIQKSTFLEVKGAFEEFKPEITMKTIELKECGNYVGQSIEVAGYISCTFRKLVTKNSTYSLASITDGTYKIELRSNEDFSNSEFTLGTCVEVQGMIEAQKNGPIHIRINNLDRVKEFEKKRMGFIQVLAGYNQLKPISPV